MRQLVRWFTGSVRDLPEAQGPDFICFGSQKAGTRWLYDQMNNRHDVWMPPIKEIDYFNGQCLKPKNLRTLKKLRTVVARDPGGALATARFVSVFERYDRATCDVDWYRNLFRLADGLKSGDISPNYSNLDARTITTIGKSLPTTKFIMLVREPMERLWSALCMKARNGRVRPADLENWERVRIMLKDANLNSKSRQSAVWSKWSACIPGDRVRYWFFDDIVRRPEHVVGEICRFIGVEPRPGSISTAYNKKHGKAKVAMPPRIRRQLAELFAAEYQACARVFAGHAVDWMDSAEDEGSAGQQDLVERPPCEE